MPGGFKRRAMDSLASRVYPIATLWSERRQVLVSVPSPA